MGEELQTLTTYDVKVWRAWCTHCLMTLGGRLACWLARFGIAQLAPDTVLQDAPRHCYAQVSKLLLE